MAAKKFDRLWAVFPLMSLFFAAARALPSMRTQTNYANHWQLEDKMVYEGVIPAYKFRYCLFACLS